MALRRRLRRSTILGAAVIPVALFMAAETSSAAPQNGPTGLTKHATFGTAPKTFAGSEGEDSSGESRELMDRTAEYAAVRTAPAATVSSAAFDAAYAQAAALPSEGGQWTELTDKPYNADNPNYADPFWSNTGAGYGLVSGRMSAIAVDGDTVYAGAADGGVWKSTDKGAHWTPTFDQQSRLSIGALAIDPADHSVWVGTGEANTAIDNFRGDGIYRSADGGQTWQLVGDQRSTLVSRITFDGQGYVYAATSNGLIRRSALDLTAPWTTVLKPDPNPTGSPYRTSWMSDVRVRPGTHGQYVVAVLGWRGGTLPDTYQYNGFYVSTQGGVAGSFHRVSTPGINGPTGRVSLDYGRYGDRLYAVVEDPTTVGLNGIYRSNSGKATGPWTLVADSDELGNAPNSVVDQFEPPGVQSWYNQYILVDPKDPSHVYLGLEEIYESNDYGNTWTTISPYWNFGLPCFSSGTCHNTTHSDQHAAFVAPDGTAYFGNDGGMYSRPASLRRVIQWNDLNRTLHTLQYYYANMGRWPGGGDAIWGGTQDNGTTLLKPNAPQIVSPMGGDGADVIVDPKDARRAVTEYVYLTMARTENGGRSDGSFRTYTNITPTCFDFIEIEFHPNPCDPNPRFIAPFEADRKNINHWVAGGQFIWDNQGAGWNTVCTDTTCSWKPVHDLGAGQQTTALGVVDHVIYAGWCGNGCNPGGSLPFISGIDTNYGGTWHRVNAPNLPNRIPTSFLVDRDNPAHVFVTFGSFSRRWIPSAGVGHLFESWNGGATWADRSGNLPDAPANDVEVVNGKLAVGTDVGVFFTSVAPGATWKRAGTNLPNAATLDIVVSPDRSYIVAATHGRGLWRLG